MRKRVSTGVCLLICVLMVFLAGCGNTADKTDGINQDSQSEDTGSSESASESTITGNAPDSESEVENLMTETIFSKAVAFGSYPQQSDSAEPIEWIVLDDDGESVLLLSRYCLASLPWHNDHEAVTWNESDIRVWLNGEFLEAAFSEEERTAIVPAVLDNGDDLNYGTPVGEDTTDFIFLLSAGEAMTFLGSGERTAAPSDYALQQGAYTNGSGNCAWWLRSPGMTDTSPAYFASAGEIGDRAHEANEQIIGVRPAVRVKRSFITGSGTAAESMPEEAAALYDWFAFDQNAGSVAENTEITATGIVTYVGTDIHGLPSFRLSDSVDGNCYVHACLASQDEYGDIKIGDEITVKGRFHIFSEEWGVVLKRSVVI